MKKLSKKSNLLLLALAFIFALAGCSKKDNITTHTNNNANLANLNAQIAALPAEPLSTAELNSLSFMKEEEKLARDVYVTLYNKWGVNIFTNITSSEQTHMDAISLLFSKYHLNDPVGTNGLGVFTNNTLQQLYNQLVTQGSISVLDAYKVGATIEDLDIFDLTNALTTIDNQDITLVYNVLLKGSRNHLRSYYKNILNAGGTYTPQYISQTAFNAIINSEMETGF